MVAEQRPVAVWEPGAKERLRATGLFNALSEAEVDAMMATAQTVTYPPGRLVIQEGDIGDSMFIILDGVVQVFTTAKDGRDIVLQRAEAGQHFGEQALLPGSDGRRRASVRAYSDTTLLHIRRPDFQRVLSKDSPLKDRLMAIGRQEVQHKMMHQSTLFRSLQFDGRETEWYQEEVFADNQIIFREGDAGDCFYFILAGKVDVYKERQGSQQRLTQLQQGQGFGELALLRLQPRAATIVAHGEVRALGIQGEKFRTLYQDKPELRQYLQTLQKVYSFTGRGFITQHAGKFMEMDSVTNLYHLTDGTAAISSQVIGQHIFTMTLLGPDRRQPETITYEDPSRALTRQLVLSGRQITSVLSHGLWTELGKVHQMILDKKPISEAQLAHFRRQGMLDAEKERLAYQPEDIVCECMQVNYGALTQAIRAGHHTTAALAEKTGASRVCGSCRPQLGQLVGQEGWTPVMLLEEFEVVEGIRSFRFAPYDNVFKPAKPGQHVVIQACLDGKWVQRPYTISSPAGETRYREITVKREPLGYFSNWLFDRGQEQALLRLSDPQGEYVADLTNVQQPIVCLVAGIGVTPALAILRSSLQEGTGAPLLIDYCVTKRAQIIYQEEVQRAAADHGNVTVHFRVTEETGRISQADIDQIRQQYPEARYYICGPAGYQTAVSTYLAHSGVPAGRINVEAFTPVGGSSAAKTGEQRMDQVYTTIGLVLVAAFLLQAALPIKWPWLENRQALESYKRWSGLALLVYMGGQWILPYLRFNGRFQAAARHYRLHKRQGAFLPLVYYFHSTVFGYAYLLALSSAFFATIVLGLLEPGRVARPPRQGRGRQRYTFAWLATHVALAVLIIALVIYHIFVVFYYP